MFCANPWIFRPNWLSREFPPNSFGIQEILSKPSNMSMLQYRLTHSIDDPSYSSNVTIEHVSE